MHSELRPAQVGLQIIERGEEAEAAEVGAEVGVDLDSDDGGVGNEDLDGCSFISSWVCRATHWSVTPEMARM